MKLIVGLGNPGSAYTDSRHNIGFLAIKGLAKEFAIALKRNFGTAMVSGRGKISGKDVVLAEPLTFMNRSGIGVLALVKKYKLDSKDLLVICDDLDLDFGRLKIKESGSSGGHRGLESIIDSLGTRNFARLRIGIGRPYGKQDAAEYVLAPFTKKEKESMSLILNQAGNCVACWVLEGIAKTMNMFNKNTSNSLEHSGT